MISESCDSIQWNAAELLPPVDCPLVILVAGVAAQAERVGHIPNRNADMDYRLATGQMVTGRFPWTYP